MSFLIPLLQGMTERQHHLMLVVQSFLKQDRPDAPAMSDTDIEQAARALAETYETASRGIIYEHSAGLASAERLSAEIKTVIEAQTAEGLPITDADAALVMRRIETASREARATLPGGGSAYLDLLKRVLRDTPQDSDGPGNPSAERGAPGRATGLIIPGT